jgi:large subunit ribosomal protein L25
MKSKDLKASLRKELGKKSSVKLRKQGLVPCVLYGGSENVHFYADEKSFRDLIYTNQVYIVNLDIDGKIYPATIQEKQFHPVSEHLVHLDFHEVKPGTKIVINLPVEITGNSIGIKAGGKLRQRRRYLKVRGLVENLPDSIIIDITDLDIGKSIQAGDLKFENFEIIEPSYQLVVGVISSRQAAKGTELPETGAPAAAEGEAAKPAEEK